MNLFEERWSSDTTRKPRKLPSIAAQFAARVQKDGPNGCWLWTGRHLSANGYGIYGYTHSDAILAHRLSFLLHNGPIPAGHFVCHHCDNPGCVNPAHLFTGTSGDNFRDCHRKGRARSFGRNPTPPEKVRRVIELQAAGWRQCDIVREVGLNKSVVADIRHRRHFNHRNAEHGQHPEPSIISSHGIPSFTELEKV